MADETIGDEAARLAQVALDQPAFSRDLGITLTEWSKDRVTGELRVTERLSNRNGVMHGGAVMALGDNMGGTFASLHLQPGQMTTTLESKTNFLRAIPLGETATATATALHVGRRTIVVETRISRADGKVAAIVTQTQMMIPRERD